VETDQRRAKKGRCFDRYPHKPHVIAYRNQRHHGQESQNARCKYPVAPVFMLKKTDHKNRHGKKKKTYDREQDEPQRIQRQITLPLRRRQSPPERRRDHGMDER